MLNKVLIGLIAFDPSGLHEKNMHKVIVKLMKKRGGWKWKGGVIRRSQNKVR